MTIRPQRNIFYLEILQDKMQTPSLCLASLHYLRTVWQLKVSKTHGWSLRRTVSFNPWELRDKHGDREWRTSGENFGFHCLLVFIVQRHWVYHRNGTERMQHFLSAALTKGVFLTAADRDSQTAVQTKLSRARNPESLEAWWSKGLSLFLKYLPQEIQC